MMNPIRTSLFSMLLAALALNLSPGMAQAQTGTPPVVAAAPATVDATQDASTVTAAPAVTTPAGTTPAVATATDSVKVTYVVATKVEGNEFNLDIYGQNFSLTPEKDQVILDGEKYIVRSRGANKQDCDNKIACLWVENEHRIHVGRYQVGRYEGSDDVAVRVNKVSSSYANPVIFARFSGVWVAIVSLLTTLLLFGFVYWLTSKGLSGNKVGSKSLRIFQTFIFDPETNSYSLSKFQLLAFSATFIFGYIYVLLSRSLVQWQFAIPDVPGTIAELLGISGGTVIAASGLTSARGSKGAGLQFPTGADLVSMGGVVVPERFQFFVWTILGCGGFLLMLVCQDPAKLSDFPTIPQGLLAVMGVSAAGYLGGKATRKPGPILEYIAVKKPTAAKGWPTLVVQGQNLASDGRLFVDQIELGFPTDEEKSQYANLPSKLLVGTPQMGAADTNFCTQLQIAVLNSSIDLSSGHHSFRVVNRDGQFADITFTADQAAISCVYDQNNKPADGCAGPNTLAATDQSITVVIAGTGLVAGSTVAWKGPGQNSFAALAAAPGGPGDGTELWVSMVPGLALGQGAVNVTLPTTMVGAPVQVVGGAAGGGPLGGQPAVAGAPPAAPQVVVQPVAAIQADAPAEDLSDADDGSTDAAAPAPTVQDVGTGAPAQGAEGVGEAGAAAPAPGARFDKK